MSGVGKVLLSPAAALVGALLPKAPKVPQAQPAAVTKQNTAVLDAVSQRRGSLANRRTGQSGAEASGGKKTSLGA